MSKNNDFLTKLLDNIDPTKFFSDFIIFLSSLVFIGYAGGYSYLNNYYNKFNLTSFGIWSRSDPANTFIDKIILGKTSNTVSFVALALLFASIYYIAANIIKNYYGYLLISFTVAGFILLSVIVGKSLGQHQATKNLMNDCSQLPKVQAVILANRTIYEEHKENYENTLDKLKLFNILHSTKIKELHIH